MALSLTYESSELVSIDPGPKLTAEDVDSLRAAVDSDLLADVGTKVRRAVVFAGVPVDGSWRYRDRLQILSVPPEAPRPPALLADHPFILEVVHNDSPDFMLAGRRGLQELREVNLVLAGLIPWIDARPLLSDPQLWAFPMDEFENLPDRSSWCQVSYKFPGLQLMADDLAEPSDVALETVPDAEYYARLGVSGYEVLDLPESIDAMLERAFALDVSRKGRFLGWCFWMNHSSLVWRLSQSASYMAIIQAVEALRPDVSSGPPCHACGRPTGAGPTQQFMDFLEEYAPRQDDETERERRTLYRLRSGLTHGGKLLAADFGIGLGVLRPDRIQERHSADRARRLARIAGINWLSDRARV